MKAAIKEPEFELPPGASPQYAKALRKKARLGAKKDALQVRHVRCMQGEVTPTVPCSWLPGGRLA